MDKIDIKTILNKFKELIFIAVLALIILFGGIYMIIDQAGKLSDSINASKVIKNKSIVAQKNLDDIKKSRESIKIKQNKLKPFYEPKNHAENSITAFGGMFDDMIYLIKKNNIMLRSVQYFINPEDDRIYQLFPANYNVCKVEFVVATTYPQLLCLIKDLQNYSYFLNIAEIKLTPYERNRKIIIATVSVMLYSKKKVSRGN